ncbi:MAG: GNAT family N-acetyltransferase [Candidatus Heimdallarchaeota archaeon]|nr:GNAT family N-acetyltransferase [Candidatus Heimdallarchaeota archaeon]
MNITYSSQRKLSVEEFISILNRSGLAEGRPVSDIPRLEKMLKHGTVLITVWDDELLVGVGRTITDYSFCSYMSDLAVDKNCQRQGIGKIIIDITREIIGKDVMLLLVSAPAANIYYAKVGFVKMDRAWIMMPD